MWWCGGVVSALDGRRQVGGVRKGATGRAGASGRGGGPARLNWGLHLEVGGVPGGAGLVFRFFRHNIDASTCQPATRVVTAHTTPCGAYSRAWGDSAEKCWRNRIKPMLRKNTTPPSSRTSEMNGPEQNVGPQWGRDGYHAGGGHTFDTFERLRQVFRWPPGSAASCSGSRHHCSQP